MNIEFFNNEFGKRLKLTQNGNTFNILFGGNLDLYFQPDIDRMKLITNREPLEFVISEEDFKLRGHGDLFGTKQSGDMEFKIANLKDDYKILLQAKKDSMEYLKNKKDEEEKLKKALIASINNA